MLKNLKKLREEAGVSQQLLATTIGVSQQSINKYENHNIEPDIETLIRIADYFETSVDYLVGHTDIRRKIEPLCACELNEIEMTIVQLYQRLSTKQRETIMLVMQSYIE